MLKILKLGCVGRFKSCNNQDFTIILCSYFWMIEGVSMRGVIPVLSKLMRSLRRSDRGGEKSLARRVEARIQDLTGSGGDGGDGMNNNVKLAI